MYLKENLEKMDKTEMANKIKVDHDFIKAPKYANSLNKFLAKVDKIPDNNAIARLLMLTPKEVEEAYNYAVSELRREMSDGNQN